MIYIPKSLFELLSLIDIAFILYYFLIRKKSKVTEPKVNLRHLGYYLIFASFFLLFFIRFFANIPSYSVWYQSIVMSILIYLIGMRAIKNG